MQTEVTQSNVTRNQSTATYKSSNLIMFAPKYGGEITYKNTSGATLEAVSGLLVVRDTTLPNTLKSATTANLADVVGVLLINDSISLANNATVSGQYLIGGELNADELVLPATVTLNTVVGNKFLKDILTHIGFKLNNVIENSSL